MIRQGLIRTSAVAAVAAATAAPGVAQARHVSNNIHETVAAATKFADDVGRGSNEWAETEDGWVTLRDLSSDSPCDSPRCGFSTEETDDAVTMLAEIFTPGYLSDDSAASGSTFALQTASLMTLAESQMSELRASQFPGGIPWQVIAQVSRSPAVQAAFLNDPYMRDYLAGVKDATSILPPPTASSVLLPAVPVAALPEQVSSSGSTEAPPGAVQEQQQAAQPNFADFAEAVGAARKVVLGAAKKLVDSVLGAFRNALSIFDGPDEVDGDDQQPSPAQSSPLALRKEPLVRLVLTVNQPPSSASSAEGSDADDADSTMTSSARPSECALAPVSARLVVSRKEKLAEEVSQVFSVAEDEEEREPLPKAAETMPPHADPRFMVVLAGVFVVICVVLLRRHGITIHKVGRMAATAGKAAGRAAFFAAAAAATSAKSA